jgi:hypothetical protein
VLIPIFFFFLEESGAVAIPKLKCFIFSNIGGRLSQAISINCKKCNFLPPYLKTPGAGATENGP